MELEIEEYIITVTPFFGIRRCECICSIFFHDHVSEQMFFKISLKSTVDNMPFMAINKCIIMRAIRSGKSFVSALYRRKVYGPENSAQTVT